MSEADRKAFFKKSLTVEDSRRKRENQRTQIRKKRLRESMMKRRRRRDASEETHMPSQSGATSFYLAGPDEKALASAATDPRTANRLKMLPQWAENIASGDLEKQVYGTVSIRRLLSIEGCPPITQVVNAGVVPRLVEFLKFDPNPVLQFEAAWALTNIASGSSEHTQEVLSQGALPTFVRLLGSSSEDVREQCVWALGNIAGDSVACRDMVIEQGALELLVHNLDITRNKLSLVRNGVWTLSNLCRSRPMPPFERTSVALPVLSQLVYMEDDEDILIDTLWSLSYLSDGDNPQIEEVLKLGIIRRLVSLLLHPKESVVTPALRTVGNIVTGDDLQTDSVLNVGVLRNLLALLDHDRRTMRKETCWTVSNITAGKPAQIQQVIDAGIIEPVVQLLKADEFEVKKEAAWVVSNATAGGSPDQIEFLVQAEALDALCGLLGVMEPRVVLVALEGVENILRTGSERAAAMGIANPYADRVEACGGLDSIDALQHHTQDEIYKKASSILTQYFAAEEVDDSVAPAEEDGQYHFGAGDAAFGDFGSS